MLSKAIRLHNFLHPQILRNLKHYNQRICLWNAKELSVHSSFAIRFSNVTFSIGAKDHVNALRTLNLLKLFCKKF